MGTIVRRMITMIRQGGKQLAIIGNAREDVKTIGKDMAQEGQEIEINVIQEVIIEMDMIDTLTPTEDLTRIEDTENIRLCFI